MTGNIKAINITISMCRALQLQEMFFSVKRDFQHSVIKVNTFLNVSSLTEIITELCYCNVPPENQPLRLWHTMKAAFVVLCGCLQTIRITRTSISMITETQSRLHHSRACRESTALDIKMLRKMAKKTEENIVSSSNY